VIPEIIALRIFQRSFSTKGGRGRGIGTYASNCLANNTSKGRVGFTSTVEEGTTFFIELPK
jgi:sensor histidine kinase regulating citrate/malate metabolism